jgi:hypothetical protein
MVDLIAPRSSPAENYIETIHASFDFEVNAPYLMYTHGNSEVSAWWKGEGRGQRGEGGEISAAHVHACMRTNLHAPLLRGRLPPS